VLPPISCRGPETTDPNFIYLQHGQLHLGNFSASVPLEMPAAAAATVGQQGEAAGRTHTAAPRPPPRLSWEYQLQVEGNGWVRNLSHGLPHTRLGLQDHAVESVEQEPRVLTSVSWSRAQLWRLSIRHRPLCVCVCVCVCLCLCVPRLDPRV
jgi:hypothetical protein